MPRPTFTLAEANALLPTIRPLMARLLDAQARLALTYQTVEPVLGQAHLNVGSPETNELIHEFETIEKLVHQIRGYGCRIEDLRVGFVDFPAVVDGRELLLCWRFGEETITHAHDLGLGFMDRQPLS